ncbi:MAG: GAF domain-containing protein [Rhizobiaceae bacterium]
MPDHHDVDSCENLRIELDRALEREAAMREVLQVINQSRHDEGPVFEAIVERARRLCDSSMSVLVLGKCGDSQQRLAAHRGMPEQVVEMYRNGQFSMDPETAIAPRSILKQTVLNFDDMADIPEYLSGDPRFTAIVDDFGARSNIVVPLILDDEGIGCLFLPRREVRPYSEDEVKLAETFAEQAVIAIENVRQFREVQERLEREEASREILEVISLNPDDEQPVFEAIINRAAKLCRAPHAELLLRDAADQHLFLAAANAEKSGYVDYLRENPHSLDDKTSLTVEAVQSMQVRQYPDIETLPGGTALSDQLKNTLQLERMRTLLYVPLIKGNRAIGTLGLYRLHVEEFTVDDIEMLKLFAAQAVIAIENVRQFRELQTRLEREKATGDVLSVISRSRDDEDPVFASIHESASRLCDAPFSGLFLVDGSGENLRMASHVGGAEEYVENARTVWPLSDPSAIVRAVTKSEIIHIHDLSETKPYRDGHDPTVRAVDIEGTRTFLAVPLMRNGEAIGSIGLYRVEARPFTDDQIDLVRTFAAQAVIAIENVRQFREVQERLEREAASREILQVISASRDDPAPVFDVILKHATQLSGAPLANLALLDDDRSHWRLVAHLGEGLRHLKVGETTTPLDSKLVPAVAMRTASVVHIENLMETDLYRQGDPGRVAMVEKEGMRTIVGVPLLSDGEAIGSITLFRREVKAFTSEEILLVETFAAQAVIAIENVKQYRALADRTAEVEALNSSLESRVEDQVGEIERMGRLKRFLPSAVADAVVTTGDESMLSSHRALIATLFCDMRGFTAFCEAAEPEETIEVLQTYHQEMSELIDQFGGGVDQRAGDGIMVIFNDPIPVDDPSGDAVRLALAMRLKMRELCAQWKKLGHRLGFGIGISFGYATVGMVGSAGRFDYTASGTSVNTAARLCDMAKNDEILISPRAWAAVEGDVEAESRGEVEMKGIREPVEVFAVVAD